MMRRDAVEQGSRDGTGLGTLRVRWICCFALAATFVWSAAAAPGAVHAAEIVIALGNEPTSLDPQREEDGAEQQVTDNVQETLMARDAKGALKPALAAEPPSQPSATAWRFKLRPGVSFTNGEPFNADAAVFSIKRIIDPAYKSAIISFFSTITDAKKVDDLTIDVLTSGPDPILPSRMVLLKMLAPGAAAKPDVAQNPIGTGPYKFVNWTRGQSIKLVRNDAYWGTKPTIDGVTYRFVGDSGTRLAGLKAGEFDIIQNLLPEFFSQVPTAKAVQGLEQPMFVLSAVSGITADKRVRQALNYAIDKEGIVEGLFGKHASVSQGQLLVPSYFGFDPQTKPYPYDLAKAKALLREAGAAGKTLTLVGESGRWLKDREIIEAVAQMWTEAGIKVDVRILDFSEYLRRMHDRTVRPDALFVSNSNELLDADRPLSAYYSMSGPGSSNSDAAMKADIDAARIEIDPAKRLAMYHKVIRHAREEAVLAWMIVMEDIYGASARLKWEPRVDGRMLLSEMMVSR